MKSLQNYILVILYCMSSICTIVIPKRGFLWGKDSGLRKVMPKYTPTHPCTHILKPHILYMFPSINRNLN